MAKNIEINYNNGSGYDVLYPKTDITNTVGTLPISRTSGSIDLSSRTSGTLPLSKGGTGKTSASSAIANLIYNGSSVSSLSGSNKIGVATSTSIGGGITVTNLVNYIKSNMGDVGGVEAEIKKYTGTDNTELIFSTHGNKKIRFMYISTQSADSFNVLDDDPFLPNRGVMPEKGEIWVASVTYRNNSWNSRGLNGICYVRMINDCTVELTTAFDTVGVNYSALALFW